MRAINAGAEPLAAVKAPGAQRLKLDRLRSRWLPSLGFRQTAGATRVGLARTPFRGDAHMRRDMNRRADDARKMLHLSRPIDLSWDCVGLIVLWLSASGIRRSITPGSAAPANSGQAFGSKSAASPAVGCMPVLA